MVVGGGVCVKHGGGAPQVRAAREARILAGEASLAIGADDQPRDPREALKAAAADADAILQRLKRQVAAGEQIDGVQLQALGEWLDRASRLSKVVLDARINEQLVELEQAKAQLVIRAFLLVVDDELALPPADRDRAIRSFLRGLGRKVDDDSVTLAGELA